MARPKLPSKRGWSEASTVSMGQPKSILLFELKHLPFFFLEFILANAMAVRLNKKKGGFVNPFGKGWLFTGLQAFHAG